MSSIQASAGAIGTVGELFSASARLHAGSIALQYRDRRISYAELLDRVRRATAMLMAEGLRRGDRLALLSRNRPEYFEIELAAANLGVITACLNWRLSPRELAYCVELVSPKLVITEPDLAGNLALERARPTIELGAQYERLMAQQDGRSPPVTAHPEDGLFILYTSGTTGLPKGAVVSHRAEIVRNLTMRAELGLAGGDGTVAWPPLYHMGATEWSWGTLMAGGTVYVVDGYDPARIAEIVAEKELGWL